MKARYYLAWVAALLLLPCATLFAQIQGNWRQIGSFGQVTITAVHFFNIQEGMVGYGSTIQYTTNGGKNWTVAKTPSLPRFAGKIRDFYFRDRWNGWAAFESGVHPTDISIPGVWKTTDGGVTWVGIDGSYQCNSVFVGTLDNLVYSTGKIAWIDESRAMMSRAHQSDDRFLQQEFWRTSNGGRSWVPLPRKEETWGLYYQKSSNTFYCYPENSLPGQGYGLFKSSDFGDTWTFIDHRTSITRNTGEIVGFDESIYIQGNGIYRSTDRGASFQFVGGPYMGFDVRMSVPPSCNGGVVIAPDQFGTLWMTTDGGDGQLANKEPLLVDHPAQISTSTCTTPVITVPLENGNCMDVTVLNAVFETNANRFQLQPHQWPLTLRPGETDSIEIRFIPGAPPEKIQGKLRVTGIVKLPTGDIDYDRVFQIEGLTNFDSLGLVMNLDTVDWGLRTNCVGCDTTITLTNLTCDTVIISSAGLDNTNFIAEKIDLPLRLAPGGAKRIAVSCDISKRKAIHATYTAISRTAKFGLLDTVSIGLGAVTKVDLPELTLLSDTIDFGTITLCEPMDTLISLFNMGCDSFTVKLENGNIAPFNVALSSADALGAGGGRVLSMRFAPSQTGEFSKTIRFLAERLGLEFKKDVYLHGFATSGESAPSFASLSVALDTINVCQSLMDTIRFVNQSCTELTITGYEVDQGGELTATVDEPLVGTDSSGYVVLHFDPATEGQKTFRLHLRSITGSSQYDTTIPIQAYVKAGERTISQSADVVELGEESVCITAGKDLTLTNNGCDTLTITAADLSSNFMLMGVALPMKLAPGESRSIVVLGLVDTLGHKTTSNGTLSFSSNADNTLPPIALSRGYIYPRLIDLDLSAATPASSHNDEVVGLDLSAIGDMAGVTTLEFDLVYDADLLSNMSLSRGTVTSNARDAGGLSRQRIRIDVPEQQLTKMSFVTRLAIAGETPITIENVRLNGDDEQFENCVAKVARTDSSRFEYLYDCSEHSLQRFLSSGELPLRIIAMRPNPVEDRLTLDVVAPEEVEIQIIDALGKPVSSQQGRGEFVIDTRNLSSGLYFVRASSMGSSVVRSLIKR